ncbi:MAG: translation initiation factor IF-2 [bacterium]
MTNTNHKEIVRPPVICIMGHIDHGKSTLLDYIRKTNIVDKEAGGITQKISAYEVIHKTKDGREEKITFLDTPGHESFAKIRSRGANIADIAILVVSAEDGVKKQTIEALNCIKCSGIPYIVAINKIDKPGADIERTKINLAENEIYLEGFGGAVPYVPISAKTGQGVNDLLDMMLLVAEMEELKGTPEMNAEGVVIEANLDKQKGVSATMIIKNGTIRSGQFVTCGNTLAPVRIMENFLGKKITEATFSSPIQIIGFDKLPKVGTPFFTFNSKKEAEQLVAEYQEPEVTKCHISEEEAEDAGLVRTIIKADVTGSIEGIEHELQKIQNDRIKIKVIHSGVGDISENDINMAAGKTGTIIVGFDVKVDSQAQAVADRLGIQIKIFNIIYKLTEWLQEMAIERTPKMMVEDISGRAKVLKYFSSVKDKHVIGGRGEMGLIEVGDDVKIMRRDVEVGRGKIRELQQQKEKVREIREGVEFGCQLQSDIEPAPGDKIEAFRIIEK